MTKLELSIDGVIVKRGDKLFRLVEGTMEQAEFDYVDSRGNIQSIDGASYSSVRWEFYSMGKNSGITLEARVKKLEDALRNLNRSQSITPSFFQMNMHE